MTRREAKVLVREYCDELLIESINLSFNFLPLPNPPLELPDFPAKPPSKASEIIQQASGISSIDTSGFLYRLEQIIEKDEPSFIKRHIEKEIERDKWILKNLETIAEQILILQIKDWFYSALDEKSPDTDRWYIAVSVLIGLILKGSDITEAQCFPLFSSIIIAKQPDTPIMGKVTGRHHISWSDDLTIDASEQVAHPSGVLAANSILDIAELHELNNETVLSNWLERLSVSSHFSNILNISLRIENLLIDANDKNSESLVMATILLLSHHPEKSKQILFEICNSEQAILRRNLATNLSRIGSEDREFTEILLRELLSDEDPDTRVLSTTYLGTLARIENSTFIELAKIIFLSHDSRMIQRLIESGIRHYFSMNTEDNEGLIPIAWVSCNSESRSTLSSMLIELAKTNQKSFERICSKILELSKESYDELFNRINLRDKHLASLIRNNQ